MTKTSLFQAEITSILIVVLWFRSLKLKQLIIVSSLIVADLIQLICNRSIAVLISSAVVSICFFNFGCGTVDDLPNVRRLLLALIGSVVSPTGEIAIYKETF